MTKEERGILLKQLRQQANLTQKEVALKMNKTPQSITQWERGATQPDMEHFIKLCELYGVSSIEMFFPNTRVENHPITEEYAQKYYKLDSHGRKVVNFLLDEEYKRSTRDDFYNTEANSIVPFPNEYPDVTQEDIDSFVAKNQKKEMSDKQIAKLISGLNKR